MEGWKGVLVVGSVRENKMGRLEKELISEGERKQGGEREREIIKKDMPRLLSNTFPAVLSRKGDAINKGEKALISLSLPLSLSLSL